MVLFTICAWCGKVPQGRACFAIMKLNRLSTSMALGELLIDPLNRIEFELPRIAKRVAVKKV